MANDGWYAPGADPLGDILALMERVRNEPWSRRGALGYELEPSFREIYMSEMDRLTRDIEQWGFHVWFTCEVDGTEYRLVAPKDSRES